MWRSTAKDIPRSWAKEAPTTAKPSENLLQYDLRHLRIGMKEEDHRGCLRSFGETHKTINPRRAKLSALGAGNLRAKRRRRKRRDFSEREKADERSHERCALGTRAPGPWPQAGNAAGILLPDALGRDDLGIQRHTAHGICIINTSNSQGVGHHQT